MKIDLNEYRKNIVEKLDTVTTSVNIEHRHKEWLDKNGVNLSALVRDIVSGLMEEDVTEKNKKKVRT